MRILKKYRKQKLRIINKGSKIAEGLDLEEVNKMSQPSTMILIKSQVNGNIETHNDIIFENCKIGRVKSFTVSYSIESSPVIFRNCIFNDDCEVYIETGEGTYFEINNLEMDVESTLTLKPMKSCIVENMKIELYGEFCSSNNASNIVMRNVVISRDALVNLQYEFNPNIVYLNNVHFGDDSRFLVEAGQVRSLSMVDVRVRPFAEIVVKKHTELKGETLNGNITI
jgi:hypothetical protein